MKKLALLTASVAISFAIIGCGASDEVENVPATPTALDAPVDAGGGSGASSDPGGGPGTLPPPPLRGG